MADPIYRRITDTIISQLDSSDPQAWVCPWHRTGGGLPANALTGRHYRGINVLTFWSVARAADYPEDRWASLRQWGELGARVRKGEKGTTCVFFKALQPIERYTSQDASQIEGGSSMSENRQLVLRWSTVFNAAQVDGAPRQETADARLFSNGDGTPVFDRFVDAAGVGIVEGSHACYSPKHDLIRMPKREVFRTAEGYAATLSHELIHATGAKHRLDRQLSNRFGSQAYAAEELIAELGSAFLLAGLGLASEPHPDHARYIAGWLPLVKRDPRALFTAAAHASRAAEFLHASQTSITA